MQRYSAVKTLALAASFSTAAVFGAEKLDGRWTATLKSATGVEIPFRLDISGEGDQAIGTLFNGRDPKTTSSARIKDGKSNAEL